MSYCSSLISPFYKSSDGEIGRHAGLKILWPVMVVRVQLPLSLQVSKWWTRVYQFEYTILHTKLSKICELKMWQYLWILIRLTLAPSGIILCEFQHVHLVMLLLVLTSNEQETRVLLVLVFLMMTKHARQVGVQPTPPPGSGALGEAQQRSRLKLLLN